MDTEMNGDVDLVARLKRLDVSTDESEPEFGYDAMLHRHAAKQRRARSRFAVARGTASALVIALVAASVWRFDRPRSVEPARSAVPAPASAVVRDEPRIVRADNYFALATLEDHIAAIDEALNDARARASTGEVARLERTRADLLDSYTRVRYANMLSANL